jgi:hypothetical protein
MTSYKLKYRRWFFFKTLKIIGHRYEAGPDKFIAFFEDGSIDEIPKWSKCYVKLGVDWVNAQKKLMEEKSGTVIPVNR